jgi:hypothetical protein
MAVTAAIQSFSGGIKPVGEALPIEITSVGKTVTASGLSNQIAYDWYINSDYVLTSLEIVKIGGALPANTSLNVEVLKYTATAANNPAANDSALVQVALAKLAPAAALGTKAIAGVLTGSLAIGAALNNSTNTNQFLAGSTSDPVQKLASQEAIAGSANSSQRIRVRCTAYNSGAEVTNANLSVFILATFCRYNAYKLTGADELTSIVVA